MDSTRAIQVAVARADLILCSILRRMTVIVPLTIILLCVVLIFRTVAIRNHWFDPYWIDYDQPGVDITSEGPDDGDPWYLEGGE